MEKELNLFEKIQAVSLEIMNLEKDLQVGQGAYAYKAVSDAAVTLAVKKAEKTHGIISIPIKQELINSEIIRTTTKDGKEQIKFMNDIKMTVRITDIENPQSFIDIESFGKGIDNGDKGFGKASTYARKYALLNAYKIATGEDPDQDKSQSIETPKTPSEKKTLVINFLNKNVKTAQQVLKHFNVNYLKELTDKDINTIYNSYKKKGKL